MSLIVIFVPHHRDFPAFLLVLYQPRLKTCHHIDRKTLCNTMSSHMMHAMQRVVQNCQNETDMHRNEENTVENESPETRDGPTPCNNITRYQIAILEMLNATRLPNTHQSYKSKSWEFWDFCDIVHDTEPLAIRHILTKGKVIQFIFYLAMCNKKKRGSQRRNTRTSSFNAFEYFDISKKYAKYTKPGEDSPFLRIPYLTKHSVSTKLFYGTCGASSWPATTSPVTGSNSGTQTWWTWRIGWENAAPEKMDKNFAPYEAVEKFNFIENEFWNKGNSGSRMGFSWLKHRFCLLFSTCSILRAESLFRGKLSDFAGLFVKKSTDVHALTWWWCSLM